MGEGESQPDQLTFLVLKTEGERTIYIFPFVRYQLMAVQLSVS